LTWSIENTTQIKINATHLKALFQDFFYGFLVVKSGCLSIPFHMISYARFSIFIHLEDIGEK